MKVVAWKKLLGLNMKFYDKKFLTFLRNRVGKILRVNDTTKI